MSGIVTFLLVVFLLGVWNGHLGRRLKAADRLTIMLELRLEEREMSAAQLTLVTDIPTPTIHRRLRELEEEGLIRSRQGLPEAVRGGRPRRFYRLVNP